MSKNSILPGIYRDILFGNYIVVDTNNNVIPYETNRLNDIVSDELKQAAFELVENETSMQLFKALTN